jgi:hypothetical protein
LTHDGTACTSLAAMKRSKTRTWLAYAAYLLAVALSPGAW